jgi:hypothetical protein
MKRTNVLFDNTIIRNCKYHKKLGVKLWLNFNHKMVLCGLNRKIYEKN